MSEMVASETPEWFGFAACVGIDPDLFFPSRGDNRGMRAAKAVCADCPVRSDCLDYAMTTGQRWGIWGGRSERERRSMRRQARVA